MVAVLTCDLPKTVTKNFYSENNLVNLKEGFIMYKIPASAFKLTTSFSAAKDQNMKKCFTSMRISVDGQRYPHFPNKENGESVKLARKVFGLPAMSTIEFTQDEMKVHDQKDQIVESEKIATFQRVQFGVIRKMGFGGRVPLLTCAMTMAIVTEQQNYYVINSSFEPFNALVALFKAQGVSVEDPFDITSLPSNEKRDVYFNKDYEDKIKGTNYPISYGSNYAIKGF